MSVLVPEEVRRLFQVLTGEDMTDADEDALFAVAEGLESGAATVEELGPVVREVVGRVRGGFSGKAADRFAERLAGFGPVLESGGVGLRELAGFVRGLALQVQYLKFVTVGGLVLLLGEVAWAVSMAGLTAGASMAWLAARFAVMRFLLSRWWGQLFMRLAVAQVVGIGMQLVVEVGAQGAQFALGTRKKWDGQLTTMAVGVGSFSALLAVPLSALGNVVGNAITKVLVRGLGDKIDAEVLAAAAKNAAEEHAVQYPLSSMAKFADMVSKSVDDYAGMSVRAMWAARFGHGLGESLEEGLTEMFGEAGYGALSGQGAQWNPFSFTAGLSEAVGSGIGNLAGLAMRGELVPAGRARNAADGEKDSATVDTNAYTTEELKTDSALQPGEKSGFLSSLSGADSEASKVGAYETRRDNAPLLWREGDANAQAALWDQSRPGTPPPPYSQPQDEDLVHSDPPGSGGASREGDSRAGMPPPAYGAVTGDVHADVESSGVDVTREYRGSALVSDHVVSVGDSRTDSPHRDDRLVAETSQADSQEAVDDVQVTEPLFHVNDAAVPEVSARADSVAGNADSARLSDGGPHAQMPPDPSGAMASGDPVLVPEPVGLPADAVRVSVPAEVVSSAGLVGLVRGRAGDVGVGPVVLVSGEGVGVAVASSAQSSRVAREVGRDVVALMPGSGWRGPRWMQFAPDGSRPRPLGEPGRIAALPQVGGGRFGLDDLASSSTAVPGSPAEAVVAGPGEAGSAATAPGADSTAAGTPEWTESDLRSAVERARSLGGNRDVAVGIVRGTHDVVALARGDAGVPLDDVVALVAVRADAVGHDEAVRFSRELAARLGTQGTGLGVRAGAGPDSRAAAKESEELARGEHAGGPEESGVPMTWGFDPGLESALDSLGVAGWSWGGVSRDGEEAGLAAFGVDAGDRGADGVDSVGAGSGRKRGREDGSVDEGAARRAAGPEDFPVLPDSLDGAGWSWGVGDVPGADPLDLAARAENLDLLGFGTDAAVFGDVGGADLIAGGAASWSVALGGTEVDSALEAVDTAENAASVESLKEAARVEARRARDAGEPYTGAELGKRLGRSKWWGQARLAEIRGESGPAQRSLQGPEGERLREAARVEARRAREAGESYTGVALGKRFGMSVAWGKERLAEINSVDGVAGRAAQEQERKWAQEREAGRVEARRARDAGEPYTGAELGEKFGKSTAWGARLVAEIRAEGDAGRSASQRTGERLREAARVEARRARDAGEPYTGAALGVKFGKGSTWGGLRLMEIKADGRASGTALPEQVQGRGPDPQSEVPLSEGPVSRGQAGGTATDPIDDLAWWGLGPAVESALDSPEVGGWSSGDVAGTGSNNAGLFAFDVDLDLDAVGPGVGGMGSFGESSGREWGRDDGSADEAVGIGPSGRQGFSTLPGFAGGSAAVGGLSEGPLSWGVDEVPGDSGGYLDPGGVGLFGFGVSLADGDAGALSTVEGPAELSVGSGGVAGSVPEGPDAAERSERAELLRETARVEARRARDAGEPYSGVALGKKFGMSRSWGETRLAEIKNEGGANRQTLREQEWAEEREAARVEARRARDAGEPYTGPALGKKFGKTDRWGRARLDEIRSAGDVPWSAGKGAEEERLREDARVEARRARDAGEPYTGPALGKKFGMSRSWADTRLAEIKDEVNEVRRAMRGGEQEWAREREAGRVEARRARDDGEPYSAAALGKRFGKSKAWGQKLLEEIKPEGGAIWSAAGERQAGQVREAARAEARRARDADEPYNAVALGEEFGKSEMWGQERLAEIRSEGGALLLSVRGREGAREAARAEARRARDAGEPYTGAALGEKFGKSEKWGQKRLAEIKPEDGSRPAVRGPEKERLREAARAEARRARDAGEPCTGAALGRRFGNGERWGRERLHEIRKETSGSAGGASGSGGGVPAEGVSSVDAAEWVQSGVESGGVAGWSESDLRREVELAQVVGGSREVAMGIVRGTHDVVALAWEDARVSLDDVVALVAVRVEAEGHAAAVRFSRELANRLGTQGSGLAIRAGAGPAPHAAVFEVSAADEGPGAPMTRRIEPAGAVSGSIDVAGWSSGAVAGADSWDGAPSAAAEDAEMLAFGAADRGVGGLGSVGADTGRKRRRDDDGAVDEGAARRPSGPQDFPIFPEFGKPGDTTIEVAPEVIHAAEAVDTTESSKEEARAEARRARDAGQPYTAGTLGNRFGKSSSWGWRRLDEIRAEGGVSRLVSQGHEAARVEARRARDAGEPDTGRSLGKKFGRSAAWGAQRLAEISTEGGVSRSDLKGQDAARVREAARVEARRALAEGKPYGGEALGQRFGKSGSWGRSRLAELSDEGSADQPVAEVQGQDAARVREAARVEACRARDAGEPYSGGTLGKKFGMSERWGRARLKEIRGGDGATPEAVRAEEGERLREAARAEARRARAAGEPYSGGTLGKKFGKSERWGRERLREIRAAFSGSAGRASDSAGNVLAEDVPSLDVTAAERPQSVVESGGVAGWTESDLRREVEWARLVGAQRDAAVEIVRGTHDVVKLARGDADVSLDDVVTLVAAKIDEVGHDEAKQFSRQLAARIGTPGTAFAIRAAAGPDPRAAAAVSEESAGSALVGDMPGGPAESPSGFGWGELPAGRTDDVLMTDFPVTGTNVVVAEGFADDLGGLSFLGDPESWFVDPLNVGNFGLGWDEVQDGRTDDVLGVGLFGAGADPLSIEWFAHDSGGLSSVGAVGGSGVGGRSRHKRARVDGSDNEGAESERPSRRRVRRADSAKRKRAAELETVWAELRRAGEAGESHTGATLGKKFGKSATWGFARLREFRASHGGTSRADVVKRKRAAVWAEMRRARDAGTPHTGESLGKKFGKGVSWGCARLAEFRASEGGLSRAELSQRDRDANLETVWAELRRADEAGESHTGATLGAKFGKSASWGVQRLAEFRVRAGEGGPADVEQKWAAVWAEVRRARGAGEPHTGKSLGVKFGMSPTWGLQRLAEFRNAESALASGSGVPTEDASASGAVCPECP
ncbi:WXG100-like domain-containing protein [Saccharopolyspora phatthalungensis]|uniref:Outer membrane channel protein CpnT-like N-terminal domain-containing protein n=1 Tax=Saccharopolyspora phatthalungensis TaxID=664693 RepID=A0A840QGG4_9PSEU|nr:hypothetical protein [Saccharopolyspora phatthalungensis]MBB5159944.1 hypothetical protein [Saccharopolyspora phatthalungensis]